MVSPCHSHEWGGKGGEKGNGWESRAVLAAVCRLFMLQQLHATGASAS